MALLTQATKESHRLNSSGAIMYFDNPLTLQHRALMSPPLPLYNSKFKKSHFIIPISGHVERNEDTSLISTEEVLPEPAFPTTECPSFPLPPPEVIQKVYQKNLEKEKLYLKFIADLVERPEPTQNYIFQMPFQSHKNVSYHGHFPRLIYFGCLSTPIHAHAQVIAFSNRNITALDLDSKPNIMSTFSPDLFSRAYFGMSRITDGHMHSTRPDEIPRKVVKIPLVPIPKAFLTPATPTPNIPALFLDFVEEAEQRNIGKFFNEEERQKEYSFGKYIQSNGSSKKSTITSLTALPSKLPYLEEISHVDTGDSLKLSSVLRLPIMNPSVENFRNHSGTIIDPGSIQQAHSITMSEFSKNAAIYNRSMELQQESKKKRAVEKAEIRLRKRSNIEFNAALPLENAKRLEKLEKNRKSAVKSREKKKIPINRDFTFIF